MMDEAIDINQDVGEKEEDFLGFYHEHCAKTFRLNFLESKACELNGVSPDQITDKQSRAFLNRVLHPEDILRSDYHLHELVNSNDPNKIVCYTQRIRLVSSPVFKPYFTSARLDVKRNCICCVSICISGGGGVANAIQDLLNDSEYVVNHIEVYKRFSSREREIIGKVCKGDSVKDIASQLFISHHTVEKHKKNIFKKGAFKSNAELMKFALSFNLIGSFN